MQVSVDYPDPPTRFTVEYRGIVLGPDRPASDYESYPTAFLDDDGVYRMWFTGGPSDQMYFAEARDPNGFYTTLTNADGTYRSVYGGTPGGKDGALRAGPSVVKIRYGALSQQAKQLPSKKDDMLGRSYFGSTERSLYAMFYEGTTDAGDGTPSNPGGRYNYIFVALSEDGVSWHTIDTRVPAYGTP